MHADVWEFSLVFEAAVKLTLAAALGGLLGFEREKHGRAAGFRTYIMVGMGSCLMMMVSIHIEEIYRSFGAEGVVRIDPGRIASYALAGIGFLGAGAIITGRGSVRGITTAAGMWAMTGVGLAIGSGYYIPGILASLLSFLILYVLRYTKPFISRDLYNIFTLVCDEREGQMARIEDVVSRYPHAQIQFLGFHRDLTNKRVSYILHMRFREGTDWKSLSRDLQGIEGVREISRREGRIP
jgi:putative Mg2+ transporter-C (MgtC) family protein